MTTKSFKRFSFCFKGSSDPTEISQDTIGAIFLASTISGDDKCKYSIFTSSIDSKIILKPIKKQLMLVSCKSTAVNKDAKLLSAKSGSLHLKLNLWFAFEAIIGLYESKKIVLEIVPWVNKIKYQFEF
jgi:hypothetical protein